MNGHHHHSTQRRQFEEEYNGWARDKQCMYLFFYIFFSTESFFVVYSWNCRWFALLQQQSVQFICISPAYNSTDLRRVMLCLMTGAMGIGGAKVTSVVKLMNISTEGMNSSLRPCVKHNRNSISLINVCT